MGNHKDWRKIAKKMRRKRIRSAGAALRDDMEKKQKEKLESDTAYQIWLAKEKEMEEFAEQEERKASILANQKWAYLETVAQEKWIKQQKMLFEEESKRKEQEALIKREWEKEQEKERLEKEEKEREEENKRQHYERLMEEMESFINGRGGRPDELYTGSATNPDKEPCPFFSKVGACRFKDSCTRNHLRPGISNVILIPGFYSHFSLDVGAQQEYDTDINLEFDNNERYRHFDEFFNDVIPEFKKFGEILLVRVCSNTEHHLRGNVYVVYSNEREAAAAFKGLSGRYYAGKVIFVEFVTIPSWKNAVCGLQFRGKCPKGTKCNFLHVFKNPKNVYSSWDVTNEQKSPNGDDWRWTPSPPELESHDERRKSKRRRRDRDDDGSNRKHRSRSDKRKSDSYDRHRRRHSDRSTSGSDGGRSRRSQTDFHSRDKRTDKCRRKDSDRRTNK